MRSITKKRILFLVSGIVFTAFYVEILLYYLVIAQCSWPEITKTVSGQELKAFIIADIHLLGPRKGHWFDKIRREWQMHRAYQTILKLHKPDVVFILGDTFDEGEWSNDKEFKGYVENFQRLFYVPEDMALHVVAGNHDLGFHNFIRKGAPERFSKMMKAPSVELISMRNNYFVLINSMAMHGDSCSLCKEARNAINNISNILKCFEDDQFCLPGDERERKHYSRPILLQHFPLYRPSDENCTEPDAPSLLERLKPFKPRRECLSRESTEYLIKTIKPRVVFGGHTHFGCLIHHRFAEGSIEFDEHSIPSFSWRNRLDPKYMLVTVNPETHFVNKCGLPLESTIVISMVVLFLIFCFPSFFINLRCFRRLFRR